MKNKLLPRLLGTALLAFNIYACGGTKEDKQINEYTDSNAITINSKPSSLEIMVKDIWEYDFDVFPEAGMNYSLKNNPPNMTIDNFGSVNLVSDYDDLGKYWVTITANNNESLARQTFPFEVKYLYMPFSTPIEYDLIKGNNDMVTLCETPCALPEDYFYEKWKGMNIGINELYYVTGIKPLNYVLPVEVHLQIDSECYPLCKDNPYSPECRDIDGGSSRYVDGERGKICMPKIYPPISGRDPGSLEDQGLLIHEMIHGIFKGRTDASAENVVEHFATTIPYVITDSGINSFCDPFFNDPAKISYSFIYELCNYGFDVSDLKGFFSKIITKRKEKGSNLKTADIRDILNEITSPNNTTDIFEKYNIILSY